MQSETRLLFHCNKCNKDDKIPPRDIQVGNVACPRCREKQEYINYGYGFKEIDNGHGISKNDM
jgi:Zn finger protein HypA/HybF involved in hydrogenase expression